MLKIGLTGSIAVGKSFVCDILRELGCHVLDADQTARNVVKKETAGLSKIIKEFGREVITNDGELDRVKMAAIVFSDEEKRLLLNSIVHPLVFEEQNRWLADRAMKDPGGIAIVDAALMIESGGYKRFDRLIVVWCERDIQLQRLRMRDGLDDVDALKRISTQMPQDEKKAYADFLIDTSGSFETTRSQCKQVHSELENLARGLHR